MSKRKQVPITLETKMKLLEEVDLRKSTKTAICMRFGIANSTLSTILANRSKLEAAMKSSDFPPGRKRMRRCMHEDLEAAVLEWFKQAKMQTKVSGPTLMEKANELAQALNIQDFRANAGWLERFKERKGIAFKCKSTTGVTKKTTAVAPDGATAAALDGIKTVAAANETATAADETTATASDETAPSKDTASERFFSSEMIMPKIEDVRSMEQSFFSLDAPSCYSPESLSPPVTSPFTFVSEHEPTVSIGTLANSSSAKSWKTEPQGNDEMTSSSLPQSTDIDHCGALTEDTNDLNKSSEQLFFDSCAVRMEGLPRDIRAILQIQITQLFFNAENSSRPPITITPLPSQTAGPFGYQSDIP